MLQPEVQQVEPGLQHGAAHCASEWPPAGGSGLQLPSHPHHQQEQEQGGSRIDAQAAGQPRAGQQQVGHHQDDRMELGAGGPLHPVQSPTQSPISPAQLHTTAVPQGSHGTWVGPSQTALVTPALGNPSGKLGHGGSLHAATPQGLPEAPAGNMDAPNAHLLHTNPLQRKPPHSGPEPQRRLSDAPAQPQPAQVEGASASTPAAMEAPGTSVSAHMPQNSANILEVLPSQLREMLSSNPQGVKEFILKTAAANTVSSPALLKLYRRLQEAGLFSDNPHTAAALAAASAQALHEPPAGPPAGNHIPAADSAAPSAHSLQAGQTPQQPQPQQQQQQPATLHGSNHARLQSPLSSHATTPVTQHAGQAAHHGTPLRSTPLGQQATQAPSPPLASPSVPTQSQRGAAMAPAGSSSSIFAMASKVEIMAALQPADQAILGALRQNYGTEQLGRWLQCVVRGNTEHVPPELLQILQRLRQTSAPQHAASGQALPPSTLAPTQQQLPPAVGAAAVHIAMHAPDAAAQGLVVPAASPRAQAMRLADGRALLPGVVVSRPSGNAHVGNGHAKQQAMALPGVPGPHTLSPRHQAPAYTLGGQQPRDLTMQQPQLQQQQQPCAQEPHAHGSHPWTTASEPQPQGHHSSQLMSNTPTMALAQLGSAELCLGVRQAFCPQGPVPQPGVITPLRSTASGSHISWSSQDAVRILMRTQDGRDRLLRHLCILAEKQQQQQQQGREGVSVLGLLTRLARHLPDLAPQMAMLQPQAQEMDASNQAQQQQQRQRQEQQQRRMSGSNAPPHSGHRLAQVGAGLHGLHRAPSPAHAAAAAQAQAQPGGFMALLTEEDPEHAHHTRQPMQAYQAQAPSSSTRQPHACRPSQTIGGGEAGHVTHGLAPLTGQLMGASPSARSESALQPESSPGPNLYGVPSPQMQARLEALRRESLMAVGAQPLHTAHHVGRTDINSLDWWTTLPQSEALLGGTGAVYTTRDPAARPGSLLPDPGPSGGAPYRPGALTGLVLGSQPDSGGTAQAGYGEGRGVGGHGVAAAYTPQDASNLQGSQMLAYQEAYNCLHGARTPAGQASVHGAVMGARAQSGHHIPQHYTHGTVQHYMQDTVSNAVTQQQYGQRGAGACTSQSIGSMGMNHTTAGTAFAEVPQQGGVAGIQPAAPTALPLVSELAAFFTDMPTEAHLYNEDLPELGDLIGDGGGGAGGLGGTDMGNGAAGDKQGEWVEQEQPRRGGARTRGGYRPPTQLPNPRARAAARRASQGAASLATPGAAAPSAPATVPPPGLDTAGVGVGVEEGHVVYSSQAQAQLVNALTAGGHGLIGGDLSEPGTLLGQDQAPTRSPRVAHLAHGRARGTGGRSRQETSGSSATRPRNARSRARGGNAVTGVQAAGEGSAGGGDATGTHTIIAPPPPPLYALPPQPPKPRPAAPRSSQAVQLGAANSLTSELSPSSVGVGVGTGGARGVDAAVQPLTPDALTPRVTATRRGSGTVTIGLVASVRAALISACGLGSDDEDSSDDREGEREGVVDDMDVGSVGGGAGGRDAGVEAWPRWGPALLTASSFSDATTLAPQQQPAAAAAGNGQLWAPQGDMGMEVDAQATGRPQLPAASTTSSEWERHLQQQHHHHHQQQQDRQQLAAAGGGDEGSEGGGPGQESLWSTEGVVRTALLATGDMGVTAAQVMSVLCVWVGASICAPSPTHAVHVLGAMESSGAQTPLMRPTWPGWAAACELVFGEVEGSTVTQGALSTEQQVQAVQRVEGVLHRGRGRWVHVVGRAPASEGADGSGVQGQLPAGTAGQDVHMDPTSHVQPSGGLPAADMQQGSCRLLWSVLAPEVYKPAGGQGTAARSKNLRKEAALRPRLDALAAMVKRMLP